MTDAEFFSALRDDQQDISKAVDLFNDGKTKEAKEAFFEYVKRTIDRTKYFKAIGLDPTLLPDELTKKQAIGALSYNMVSVS